jgi:ribosome-binding factor A
MPSQLRLKRIADRIRQELSEMLIQEVSDPRLSGVSITDVKVDRELAYADIFVSAVEGHERSDEVIQGLHSASGFLRRALADRVELRVFPRLRFHWDPTPERADHIERLLATLKDSENGPLNSVEKDSEEIDSVEDDE